MISKLNVPEETKAILNLSKLVFYLIQILHVIACAWYFITLLNANYIDEEDYDMTWIPPLDWLNYKASDLFKIYTPNGERYVMCLYHAVLMLGSNEMGPNNTAELMFCVGALISTNIMNAQIFGEMAVLVQLIQKKASNYQEKLDAANSVMSVVKIPHTI